MDVNKQWESVCTKISKYATEELLKILIIPGTLSGLKENVGTWTRFVGLSYILTLKDNSDCNMENITAIINYVLSTKYRILLFHALVFQTVDVKYKHDKLVTPC